MEHLVFIFCALPAVVTPITILPNGNSPEVKMIGGMMVDVQKGFSPILTTETPYETEKSNYKKSRKLNNGTALSINERYRRLIPYMTFYYANDLASPTTEPYTKTVEVERAEIVETSSMHRQPKKIVYSPYNNIPRYQGNRLTHYNIASASPNKNYKDVAPAAYPTPTRVTPNYDHYYVNHDLDNRDFRRVVHRPINIKLPSAPFALPTRKPYLNLYKDDSANIQYYLGEKEVVPKYKLVPYEQTPPVKVVQYDQYDTPSKPNVRTPVVENKEQIYIKPRPVRPQYSFDSFSNYQPSPRRPPTIVSESYYQKQAPHHHDITKPVIESGFKPILNVPAHTTEVPAYSSTVSDHIPTNYDTGSQIQVVETLNAQDTPPNHRPNYYQYTVDQTPSRPAVSNKFSLNDLLNSLQSSKSIPKPITKDNVGSSIRTLLQVLNTFKAMPAHNEVDTLILSTPKPFVQTKFIEEVPLKPVIESTEAPVPEVEINQEQYLAPVNPPSQHLDDYSSGGSTSQRFPLRVENDDEGGTPGRPGVDYPVLTTIPPTSFDCKTQRYKGFFADPETRCQVWHYCDLNGGQASFLCPNGTIFSQAGLTCDWWFNVRCASTAQLYVLNESLYKYILPHSPKFPEDYSGPLVDKYLTLKFKEMEEQFKKNKNRQSAADKVDSQEDEDSTEESSTKDSSDAGDVQEEMRSVSEASVVVESPGTSGNVERLHD